MKRTIGISLQSVMVLVLGFVMPVSAAPADLAAPAWHWVQPGETLFSIGRMYGVSPWSIATANEIYDLNRVYAGQRLRIPCN